MQYILDNPARPGAAPRVKGEYPMDPTLKKLQHKGQSPALVMGPPAEMAKLLKDRYVGSHAGKK
jgi:hypothetical protein